MVIYLSPTLSLKSKSGISLVGPVVKNLPSSAGEVGSIPGWGTKIPHAGRAMGPCATTTERTLSHSWGVRVSRAKFLHDVMKIPLAATNT